MYSLPLLVSRLEESLQFAMKEETFFEHLLILTFYFHYGMAQSLVYSTYHIMFSFVKGGHHYYNIRQIIMINQD